MRNAYAINNYVEAKDTLQKISRQLERINPSRTANTRVKFESPLRLSLYTSPRQ
jgi:hypothetical protein